MMYTELQLADALRRVQTLADDDVIFARRPWSATSDARIGVLDAELRVPPEMRRDGFEYFLEVPTAREVLSVFGDRLVGDDKKVRLLLHYAEHDAFPDWVYDD